MQNNWNAQAFGYGSHRVADTDLTLQLTGTLARFGDAFTTLGNKYSGDIAQHNAHLQTVTNAADVPIQQMANTLHNTHLEYNEFGEVIAQFQAELQKKIEAFRERQSEHKESIDEKNRSIKDAKEALSESKSKLGEIRDQIDDYREERSDLRYDAKKNKREASKLVRLEDDDDSDGYDHRSDRKAKDEARELRRSAKKQEKRAKRKSRKIKDLKQTRDDLEKEISELTRGIQIHNAELVELRIAIERLELMCGSLYNTTLLTRGVGEVIQEILSAIHEAETTGNPFEIFQNALKTHPGSMDDLSYSYMLKLRQKWSDLERLVANSRQRVYERVNTFRGALGQSGNALMWGAGSFSNGFVVPEELSDDEDVIF